MAAPRDKFGRPIVVVTGMGVVTSLGAGKTDNWAKLTAGKSGTSANRTAALSDHLLTDKEAGVCGAAAVALGQIADEAGVIALVGVLAPQLSAPAKGKGKREENEFVLRAAAVSLGQMKSKAGVPALLAVVSNEKSPMFVVKRRVLWDSFGDPTAIPALETLVLSKITLPLATRARITAQVT